MTALDRIMLARCHKKFASSWIGEGVRNTWNALKSPLDFGLSVAPGVSTAYNGLKSVNDLAHGRFLSAAGNAGMAGLGLIPGGGVAGKGFMRFMPKTIGRLQVARNAVGTKALSNMGGAGRALISSPKLQTAAHLGGGTFAGSLTTPRADLGGAAGIAEGSDIPMDQVLGMIRSNVTQNPMYTQPSQNPIGNFASSFRPQTMAQGMGSAGF